MQQTKFGYEIKAVLLNEVKTFFKLILYIAGLIANH